MSWQRKRWLKLSGTVLIIAGLLGFGVARVVAETPPRPAPPASFAAPEGGVTPAVMADSSIAYQGRLVDSGGNPVNGTKNITFRLYNAETGGNPLNASMQALLVNNGVFNATVPVSQGNINGQALWLELQVEGDASPMTPRQKIQAVPYALGLVPGATLITDKGWAGLSSYSSGSWQYGGIGLYGYSASGLAGLYGSSYDGVGTRGWSYNGNGVYGSTDAGFAGVYGFNSNGNGVYGLSNAGTGVYGRASSGFAGVYGMGDGGSGVGVFGESNAGYGGYFYSGNWRGLYASSAPGWYAGYFNDRGGSSSPGIYVNGTLSASGSKSGYVVDLASNEGPEPLETGDLVVIVGAGDPLHGEIPLVRVRKSATAESRSVAGVVDQPFALQAASDGESRRIPAPSTASARKADGTSIAVGSYFSMVTLGSFKAINVDAGYGAIQPGDLLVTSSHAGYAMKAANPAPGTIVGKALGSLASGTGQIPVIVTLQ